MRKTRPRAREREKGTVRRQYASEEEEEEEIERRLCVAKCQTLVMDISGCVAAAVLPQRAFTRHAGFCGREHNTSRGK